MSESPKFSLDAGGVPISSQRRTLARGRDTGSSSVANLWSDRKTPQKQGKQRLIRFTQQGCLAKVQPNILQSDLPRLLGKSASFKGSLSFEKCLEASTSREISEHYPDCQRAGGSVGCCGAELKNSKASSWTIRAEEFSEENV